MTNILFNLVLFWAALNTVFPLNYVLEQLGDLGFGWLSVLEIIYVSIGEYFAIHLITGFFIVVLGILNRFTLPRMLVCCLVLSFLIVGNRLLACSVQGSPEPFEALYLGEGFDPSLCLYYASLNFLTAFIKAFYFVGMFGLLRWIANRVTGSRFMPNYKES